MELLNYKKGKREDGGTEEKEEEYGQAGNEAVEPKYNRKYEEK